MAVIHVGMCSIACLPWAFSTNAHRLHVFIVLVKFKAGVTDAVKREVCDKVVALKETIPGITKATAGKNFSERSKGFEWGRCLAG
jgi:hypothetical protein